MKGISRSCVPTWWGSGICCGSPSNWKSADYMRLGRGEEKSGGRGKASLLVDALEAILAALYLDGGWQVAHDFIVRAIVEPELAHMNLETSAMPVMDFKSALQEALQATGKITTAVRVGQSRRARSTARHLQSKSGFRIPRPLNLWDAPRARPRSERNRRRRGRF